MCAAGKIPQECPDYDRDKFQAKLKPRGVPDNEKLNIRSHHQCFPDETNLETKLLFFPTSVTA